MDYNCTTDASTTQVLTEARRQNEIHDKLNVAAARLQAASLEPAPSRFLRSNFKRARQVVSFIYGKSSSHESRRNCLRQLDDNSKCMCAIAFTTVQLQSLPRATFNDLMKDLPRFVETQHLSHLITTLIATPINRKIAEVRDGIKMTQVTGPPLKRLRVEPTSNPNAKRYNYASEIGVDFSLEPGCLQLPTCAAQNPQIQYPDVANLGSPTETPMAVSTDLLQKLHPAPNDIKQGDSINWWARDLTDNMAASDAGETVELARYHEPFLLDISLPSWFCRDLLGDDVALVDEGLYRSPN